MSDVELGGGTAFINVGALVEPRKVSFLCQYHITLPVHNCNLLGEVSIGHANVFVVIDRSFVLFYSS